MDALHRLTESAATKLSWLLYCWRLREDVRQVIRLLRLAQSPEEVGKLAAEQEKNKRLEIEVEQLKDRIKGLEAEFDTAKEGNRALLRFVHTRHRLGTPPEFGTIRASLMKSEQTK